MDARLAAPDAQAAWCLKHFRWGKSSRILIGGQTCWWPGLQFLQVTILFNYIRSSPVWRQELRDCDAAPISTTKRTIKWRYTQLNSCVRLMWSPWKELSCLWLVSCRYWNLIPPAGSGYAFSIQCNSINLPEKAIVSEFIHSKRLTGKYVDPHYTNRTLYVYTVAGRTVWTQVKLTVRWATRATMQLRLQTWAN